MICRALTKAKSREVDACIGNSSQGAGEKRD
jgi:hypothetical protein